MEINLNCSNLIRVEVVKKSGVTLDLALIEAAILALKNDITVVVVVENKRYYITTTEFLNFLFRSYGFKKGGDYEVKKKGEEENED